MTVDVVVGDRDQGADRYHRQRLISWWDQRRVAEARVLVVGAGALGTEICKLLALTGIGRVLVFDPDHIEASNLARTAGSSESQVHSARPPSAVPHRQALPSGQSP